MFDEMKGVIKVREQACGWGQNIVKSKKEGISSAVCGPSIGPLGNNKYLSASYPSTSSRVGP